MDYSWSPHSAHGHDIVPSGHVLVRGFGISEMIYGNNKIIARGGLNALCRERNAAPGSFRRLSVPWEASKLTEGKGLWIVQSRDPKKPLPFPDSAVLSQAFISFIGKHLEIALNNVFYDSALDLRCPPIYGYELDDISYITHFRECHCMNWGGRRHFHIVEYDDDGTRYQYGPLFSEMAIMSMLLEGAVRHAFKTYVIRRLERQIPDLNLVSAMTDHDRWVQQVLVKRETMDIPVFLF